ncbi:MAG TPA: DUF3810 family protein [Vicinamibacterales bacterium]|jgi:hypothetical protein
MRLRRSVVTSLVFITVALVLALAPTPSTLVEQLFSEGFYAALQPPLTRLSNVIPFAVFDALLIFVALVLVVWLVAVFRQPRRRIWQFFLRTATLAAGLYLVFLLVWGLNYRREPFRRTLEFRQERVTPEALTVLAGRAVAELNELHGRLPTSWPAWDEMRLQLGPGFERARLLIGPKWPVEPGDPKRSLLNVYFKLTAIEGMVDPLFLEVLVNQDVLPFERPFIVAHEWGHLAGRADESEASFHGFLTCMYGPAWARYSAWISLYGTILAGLPPDAQRAFAMKLDAGPRRDLQALRERILSQSMPLARRASGAAYDRFLKANRLREGVRSYDLVVTLLLGVEVEMPALH